MEYLSNGNSLSGLSFKIKRHLLPKELKEKLYFIESIKVNGSPCDTVKEFKDVINDIRLQQDFVILSELWNCEIPKGKSHSDSLSFFSNIDTEVTKLIEIIDESEQIRLSIETFSDIKIDSFNKSKLNYFIEETEYNILREKIEDLKECFNIAKDHLSQNNIHPISETILSELKHMDLHSLDY